MERIGDPASAATGSVYTYIRHETILSLLGGLQRNQGQIKCSQARVLLKTCIPDYDRRPILVSSKLFLMSISAAYLLRFSPPS